MSDHPAAAEPLAGEPNPGLRAAALTAVIAGLVVVAGAAFVLSYQGIHQIALHAGVSPELARLYPVILDAMLVMSCAAALALRTAGMWTRCYVWACLILLLAAVAVGNALSAMNISLPAQPTRAVVAILPWALLLMGFGMLLALLRHWRRIRAASAVAGPAGPVSAGDGAAAGAALGAVSWADSPGNGPAEAGKPGSSVSELMQPPTGQPPEGAGAVAGPAAAGPAGAVPATAPSAGSTPTAAPIAGPDRAGPMAGPVATAVLTATAARAAPAAPATQAAPAAPATLAATIAPSVVADPPATAGPAVPFLERILSGPTNPHVPEADGE